MTKYETMTESDEHIYMRRVAFVAVVVSTVAGALRVVIFIHVCT